MAGLRPKLLLLGTGHWSNPGRDYMNVEFDDMLAPRRQREIEDCLACLAQFAPTKVALEVMGDAADDLSAEYARYREGCVTLTANERHQLGFRLAAMLGHERIHGIDWHDLERPIGWDRAIDFAREHGQTDRVPLLAMTEQEHEAAQAAEGERLRRMSVREQMLDVNSRESLAASHRIYMDLTLVGEGSDYVGADVILRWYERNMKIFANIARLAMSPDDRILVVIGAGHIPLLAHFAEGSGRFDVVPAGRYLA